jgi:hypothetical protein
MQYKLIQKILEHGMVLVKHMNFKICATTLYITIVKQFYPDLKIQECGMLWEVATKKWIKITRLKDVLLEPKVAKIDKELQFIKWASFIILWAQNFNLKQFMHLNQTLREKINSK